MYGMNLIALVLSISFLPFFEARNSQAVLAVDPQGAVPATAGGARPDLRQSAVCEICNGKGTLTLTEPDFGQSTGRIGSARRQKKVSCPVCRGGGRLDCYLNPIDIAAQIVRDRDAFAAAHRAAGDIALGEVFVPPALYETLQKDRKRQKLLKDAFGSPCSTCHWSGVEPCRKCKGNGIIPCPVSDCKHGWTVTKTEKKFQTSRSGSSSFGSGGYRRSSGSRRSIRTETKITVTECVQCGGAGRIRCPECNGRRAVICRRCAGTGEKRRFGGGY